MDNPKVEKGGSSNQPQQLQVSPNKVEYEFYDIELSTQMQTIDGKPLTQTRTEKVESEVNGETVITEKEMPSEPYRVVEAILVSLDNAPADFISRYMKEMKQIYGECVKFLFDESATSSIRVISEMRQVIPYIGKASNALTTFLSLQLDDAFVPVKESIISPIQGGQNGGLMARKVSASPVKS